MPIIKIQNLSKQYRLGVVGTGTLSNDLKRWWYRVRGKEDPFLKIGEANDRGSKSQSEYVWALKDINLEVNQGEVLGIIGKNGAGKSTLLKILSRVTGPTTGRIDYNGRIGSLLEVGTGFHQELTGRENIFLNGAILGMTKAEIRSKLDEIIDFSGCERYIDTPVKRYSSGMMVRLGFAVAAHLEPEILVVDEVLAVGDAEFQKKAIGKMQDVSRKEGKTVLFVSHSMGAVKNLCTKGILLADGQIVFEGNTEDAIGMYLDNLIKDSKKIYLIDDSYRNYKDISRDVVFSRLEVLNDKMNNLLYYKESLRLKIDLISNKDLPGFVLSYTIFKADGYPVGSGFSDYIQYEIKRNETFSVLVNTSALILSPGAYYCGMAVSSGDNTKKKIDYDVIFRVPCFEVLPEKTEDSILPKWPANWGNIKFENLIVENIYE